MPMPRNSQSLTPVREIKAQAKVRYNLEQRGRENTRQPSGSEMLSDEKTLQRNELPFQD
jgi:hypothetical protein